MDLEAKAKEDPYEEKLYFLFNSHSEKVGFLNKIQLEKLCTTLQLNAPKSLQLKDLLTEKCDKITFQQFREGLLKIITAEESNVSTPSVKNNSDQEHSDREISPKLIVGSKKYGRRSRPSPQNSEEFIDDTSDSDNETMENSSKKPAKVQRSASDVHTAKRKRPMYASKLKRCASLPSHKPRMDVRLRQQQLQEELENDEDKKKSLTSLSQNLRAVWDSFDANRKDIINFSQLEIVCEKVGLHKIAAKLAAEEVFEKLAIEKNDGISFNDFMNLLQSDSDMFSSVENVGPAPSPSPLLENECKLDTKTPHTTEDEIYTPASVWSTENGSLTNEAVVNLWEAAGINDADKLLSNLGFFEKDVQISELSNILEEEIQRTVNNDMDLMPLIKATLTLHKAELTSLKQVFRQVVEENRKLFTDNKEVNRRASILAHEIDERHSNLEDSTRSEIRSLEIRHSEMVRELSMQLANEREQLASLNTKLEMRIKEQEVEEQKLRNDILSLQNEYSALESEQSELHKQITELLEQNIKLNQEIADMEQNDDGKLDHHNEEVLDLIEKIETLQMENSNLRDKNDELCSDLENANMELMKMKGKNQKFSKNVPETGVEQVDAEQTSSTATKRRGDSPSKARISEESPRLGKVRKFSNDVDNENEGDWIALNSELNQLNAISLLQKSGPEIVNAEQKREEEIDELKLKVQQLEMKIEEYNNEEKEKASPSEKPATEDLESIRKEKETLAARVAELEQSLEQMSAEYENCEDYWQSKLNEERMLFDEEQRISDEKFAELLQKMAELEEQFSNNEKHGRLSPIDEKCQLESQYLELENEMEDLKVHAQSLLDDKSIEIENLKKSVAKLREQLADAEKNKISPRPTSPEESLASSPINYLWNQNTITGPVRDYQNPNFVKKICEPEKIETDNEKEIRVISPIQKPVSANPQTSENAGQSQEEQQETNRDILEVCEALSVISSKSIGSLHDIQKSLPQSRSSSPMNVTQAQEDIKKLKAFMEHLKEDIKELSSQRESLIMEFQQMNEAKPILAKAYRANHPNLNQKIQNLEQKNRHLQSVLKQQQQYAESIMHQTWQQQRAELNELRNRLEAQSIVISEQAQRLASADLLVKDLYVENSHLSASLQRVEQQLSRNAFMHMANQTHHHSQSSQFGSLTGMP